MSFLGDLSGGSGVWVCRPVKRIDSLWRGFERARRTRGSSASISSRGGCWHLRGRDCTIVLWPRTLLGFLKALPNYDERTPLESWLFSIASHKLVDALRRSGRRPVMPLLTSESKDGAVRDLTGPGRAASSIMRSSERARAEAGVIEAELRSLLGEFRRTGAWERLKCVELIFVLGWANKDVARRLNLTELAVANHKYFVVQKLREAGRSARVSNELLSAPELD